MTLSVILTSAAVLIALASSQHENVFEAAVLVQRHFTRLLESQQRRRRFIHTIAIEPVNLHPFAKWLPQNLVLPFCYVE